MERSHATEGNWLDNEVNHGRIQICEYFLLNMREFIYASNAFSTSQHTIMQQKTAI